MVEKARNLPKRVLMATPRICFEAQTGKHVLGLNFTAFDPIRTLEPNLRSRRNRIASHEFSDNFAS
jgi:hypothetical protein